MFKVNLKLGASGHACLHQWQDMIKQDKSSKVWVADDIFRLISPSSNTVKLIGARVRTSMSGAGMHSVSLGILVYGDTKIAV